MSTSSNYSNNFNDLSEETINRVTELGNHVMGSFFDITLPIISNLGGININNPIKNTDYVPSTNVKESETDIKIIVLIPGTKKSTVSVTLKNSVLNIIALTEISGNEWEHITDRTYRKNIKLPDTVSSKDLNVTYEDGVLKIICKKNTTNFSEESIPIK